MVSPYYVAPDKWFRIRLSMLAEGIGKGKSIVAMESAVGITLVGGKS